MNVENTEESLQPVAFRVRSSAGFVYGKTQSALLLVEREGLTLERTKFWMKFDSGRRPRLFDADRFRTIYQLARRTPGWCAFMIVSEGNGFRVVGFRKDQVDEVEQALLARGFEVRIEVVPTRLWWSAGYFVDFLRKEGKLSSSMEDV